MQNLFNDLITLLKKDERLISSENILLKNKVQELALNNDEHLIKLLLSKENIKEIFFFNVDDILIFDKDKFIQFISNKEFLPNSYTSFKNKIGLMIDKDYLEKSKNVSLVWPYKDCILEGGMEEEDKKRVEIFFNETLAPDDIERLFEPKVLTNFKLFDGDGEHKVKEISKNDNFIIKGNNLLAIHSLKKIYNGEVKLIYIDPPYNTGSDSFKYNDSFNHSTWLTFMKNRLEIARELLKVDGVICVHCDDNEQQYLKVLMDEVFNRKNFIGLITIKSTPGGKQSSKNVAIMCDYILMYGKSDQCKFYGLPLTKEVIAKYNKKDERGNYATERLRQHGIAEKREDVPSLHFPIYYNKEIDKVSTTKGNGYDIKILPILPNGEDGRWIWGKDKVERDKDFIEVRKVKRDGKFIYDAFFKKYLTDDLRLKLPNIWIEKEFRNEVGTKELKKVFEGLKVFPYPKPEPTIKRVIECCTKEGDMVLDFFLGSGTTCAVAHKMKRQYIGIEQMNYINSICIPRMKKIIEGDNSGISKELNWRGGGSFVYCELLKWNDKYIDKVENAKTLEDLIDIWGKMKETSFLSYKVEPSKINKNIEDFKNLNFEDQKRFLIECLDKNNLYVNLSEVDDKEYNVSEEDKKLNRMFYGIH